MTYILQPQYAHLNEPYMLTPDMVAVTPGWKIEKYYMQYKEECV